MRWIVLRENKGQIELISKNNVTGMLPKGSFLTLEENNSKFVLCVQESSQVEPFSPSPLVVDMDLTPLEQDRKCRNIINAYRVHNFSSRSDGLIDYIRPQSEARLSTQEEIDIALKNSSTGPKVFIATIQYDQNHLLKDKEGNLITATLPEEMFYHQMLICGKTGQGKTVAIKHLSQHFVEEMHGAVLAINVKDVDLLKMDKPSETTNHFTKEEWRVLNMAPHGLENVTVYYPANTEITSTRGINTDICQKITLDVKKIDPDSLTGLMQNISDVGAMNFPNIFRSWQQQQRDRGNPSSFTFTEFVRYFQRAEDDEYSFSTMNIRGEESRVRLHRGTYDNILRNLDMAIDFFDNPGSKVIDESDILQKGKMSVIDVAVKNGIQFGSILLRDLLHKIVLAKSEQRYDTPVLIIIDEVHMFYNEAASTQALGDLDTICRTGRSQKIGVIFSSQNPQDLPHGLSSVINSKIFFNSDVNLAKKLNISISSHEMENLKTGFAMVSIHDLTHLKVIKFPLACCGVFTK